MLISKRNECEKQFFPAEQQKGENWQAVGRNGGGAQPGHDADQQHLSRGKGGSLCRNPDICRRQFLRDSGLSAGRSGRRHRMRRHLYDRIPLQAQPGCGLSRGRKIRSSDVHPQARRFRPLLGRRGRSERHCRLIRAVDPPRIPDFSLSSQFIFCAAAP